MSSLHKGLYEALLTEALAADLTALTSDLRAVVEGLDPEEAPDRVALHLGRIIRAALTAVEPKQRPHVAAALAGEILQRVGGDTPAADAPRETPLAPLQLLRAVVGRRPDGRLEEIPPPITPLLDTTLLTNAPGEPRVGSQIEAEIASAEAIDVVMAFVRRSGLRPLHDALSRHCQAGKPLRVLTTTYTGSTEAEALDLLAALPAEVRVSYETGNTRLHAKAWLFHRRGGFSTAFIGSSNLTHSAQVSGLEWNVRVSQARNPDVIEKVAQVFESYWASPDFPTYDPARFRAQVEAGGRGASSLLLSAIELRPEPFQERLLEQIAASRERGHHRNLLVSATGTGKTVMAAVDYRRLRERLPRARLLFVAHREEILAQSLSTFRAAMRDAAFGEVWVGGARPARFEHVFASIQSLNAAGLDHLDPSHFDVVIVDEFHHAAAPSYRALLEHVRPVELLGLTATPERADGLDLLAQFDGRIAAELRLWDAIDQHRLTPFAYFGLHDGLDLRQIPWKRGRGYDPEGLSNLLTSNDAWVKLVIRQLHTHVDDVRRIRALGFCVSIDHARYMARKFNEAGLSARAIWGDTPPEERRAALADLRDRRVQIVFSVDLFNEGVDVPTVDTLLLLRPTDSPTLFLQQLGRGLRRSDGKNLCTVLDFVGNHHREFRFDRRLRALLGGSRGDVERQVKEGFPLLPAGCHMSLDPVARDIVLRSIRQSIPSRWTEKVEELRRITRDRGDVGLVSFLAESGLDLEDLYHGNRCWSDLREAARLPVFTPGPAERSCRRALGRLLHLDDPERIHTYRRWLDGARPPDPARLDERERRVLRMLVASSVGEFVPKDATLAEGCAALWAHPQVRAELMELLTHLEGRIDHLHPTVASLATVPLQVHARYTRDEILAACLPQDRAKVAPWQTGVLWAKELGADLLAFTLDKSAGHFSPTTRYRDYAISPRLIHWESQSATRAESETGRRYRHHVARGSAVLLFARLRTTDRAFWYLGPATYVDHTSEMPMAVTWRLDHPLPGDLFATFAAAVA